MKKLWVVVYAPVSAGVLAGEATHAGYPEYPVVAIFTIMLMVAIAFGADAFFGTVALAMAGVVAGGVLALLAMTALPDSRLATSIIVGAVGATTVFCVARIVVASLGATTE